MSRNDRLIFKGTFLFMSEHFIEIYEKKYIIFPSLEEKTFLKHTHPPFFSFVIKFISDLW